MDRDEILAVMSDDTKQYIDNIVDMYNAPYARFIGFEIDSIEPDRVVCHMDLVPDLMNSMGRGHGAAVYGLLDHTFACACNVSKPSTGLSCSVNYYRPAQGRLTAVAVPINKSRSLEMYDVRAYNEAGKLVASATCTAFILKGERDGRPALPQLRGARAVEQRHVPEVLQEDTRRARAEEEGEAPRERRRRAR